MSRFTATFRFAAIAAIASCAAFVLACASAPVEPALPLQPDPAPAADAKAPPAPPPLIALPPAQSPTGEQVARASRERRLESIREWMLIRPPEAGEPAGPTPIEKAVAEGIAVDPWFRYLDIPKGMPPAQRESWLNGLLDEPISDLQRQVILRDISTDLSFQSRRARFLRRYGFYATWFNRVTYTTSRALQGNVQAFGQLLVDAVFDVFGRPESTPAERKLYRLLRKLEREGRAGQKDQERIDKLEAKVNRALAEVDVERAHWALGQADPESAEFYARGALGYLPEFKPALELRDEAAGEVARRIRGSVASAQVGYPDREPPLESSSDTLLRAALSRRRRDLQTLVSSHSGGEFRPDGPGALPLSDEEAPEVFLYEGDAFLSWMLTTLPERESGSLMAVRGWAETLNESGRLPVAKTAWLRGHLLDPQFNPDLRLARAQSTRRGNLASFIFLGPDSRREKAYAASSRLAQAWNALASVGIFYVFEVFYRAGVVAFSPPPPADEMFDSAATFIRASPFHPESQKVARWLTAQYKREGKFEAAREMLNRYGRLDAVTSQELFRAEARYLLVRGEQMEFGDPRRVAYLDRVIDLAPGTGLAKSALRQLKRSPPPQETIAVQADWAGVAGWFDAPPPAGLPGNPEWFDGDPANGEIASPSLTLSAEGLGDDSVRVNYQIIDASGDLAVVDKEIFLDQQPEELVRWLRVLLAGQNRAVSEIRRLGRSRIPYEVTGGLGVSGVDLYPRLLPIDLDPDELRLYRD